MLDFMQTTLQTGLNTILASNTTSKLKKVAVLNTNAFEKKFQSYLENEQITVVYRELPGLLPNMPIKDKVVSGNLFVYAPEDEKEVVEDLVDNFIKTYNATFQTDRVLRFTNLTPIGRADNTGAIFYQLWQFSVTALVIDKMGSIYNRSVTIGTSTLNAARGLITASYTRQPVYGEYPNDSGGVNRIFRYEKGVLQFSFLDSFDTIAMTYKDLAYSSQTSTSVTFVSGSDSITFTGSITLVNDTATEGQFPVITITIERG